MALNLSIPKSDLPGGAGRGGSELMRKRGSGKQKLGWRLFRYRNWSAIIQCSWKSIYRWIRNWRSSLRSNNYLWNNVTCAPGSISISIAYNNVCRCCSQLCNYLCCWLCRWCSCCLQAFFLNNFSRQCGRVISELNCFVCIFFQRRYIIPFFRFRGITDFRPINSRIASAGAALFGSFDFFLATARSAFFCSSCLINIRSPRGISSKYSKM